MKGLNNVAFVLTPRQMVELMLQACQHELTSKHELTTRELQNLEDYWASLLKVYAPQVERNCAKENTND